MAECIDVLQLTVLNDVTKLIKHGSLYSNTYMFSMS